MNILEQIVISKKKEIQDRKNLFPLSILKESDFFDIPALSLKESIRDELHTGIIAEFKRKSPSKGIINDNASVVEVTRGYIRAGAVALSVLTDQPFFGGSREDLEQARKANNNPILRKDFTIDEYQVYEAKAMGADAILLIAEILTSDEIIELAELAHHIGLEVVLEIHNDKEIHKICEDVDIVGINNRNLVDFSVDIETSLKAVEKIPDQFVKISESGIDTPEVIHKLKNAGFNGFLIGEYFMKHQKPHETCKEFIDSINLTL